MKDVQITVGGEAGTGKSTIVAIIEKALAHHGIEVAVEPGPDTESAEKRLVRANDPTCAAAVASKARVSLREQQFHRLVAERARL